MKYVVKNCHSCNFIAVGNQYRCKLLEKTDCNDCTDCVIKQVIGIAKDIIEKDCYENSDAKAEKILQLFDIKEVRE